MSLDSLQKISLVRTSSHGEKIITKCRTIIGAYSPEGVIAGVLMRWQGEKIDKGHAYYEVQLPFEHFNHLLRSFSHDIFTPLETGIKEPKLLRYLIHGKIRSRQLGSYKSIDPQTGYVIVAWQGLGDKDKGADFLLTLPHDVISYGKAVLDHCVENESIVRMAAYLSLREAAIREIVS